MTYLLKTLATLTLVHFISLSKSTASELEELHKLKNSASKQLITLKSKGFGLQHPEIMAKANEIDLIEDKIEEYKISFQEIVVLLNGKASQHLQGHQKFGTTDTALPELLLNGWRIKNMISIGDQKAYVCLTRE